jgi:Cof subfamily protein (haloacid dehalogenase superfamily)
MTVKLVATDLDGTLLRDDGTVSDRTRAAIQAAKDAGLLVVFVTGRPPRWLDEAVEQTGHVGIAVGANGAVIYDVEQGVITESFPMPMSLVLEVAHQIRTAFPNVTFAVEFGDGFAAEPGYTHDWDVNPRLDRNGNRLPEPPSGPLIEIVTGPVLKLLAKDRSADVDDFLTSIDTLLERRASVTHSSSFGLLEISALGVTKATGLAHVAALNDISADEVVAVGDMPNDIAMLLWAGTSYAVANAHPAAQAAAKHGVIGGNNEDAVAVLIESVLNAV